MRRKKAVLSGMMQQSRAWLLQAESLWSAQAAEMRDFHLRELAETGPVWAHLLEQCLAGALKQTDAPCPADASSGAAAPGPTVLDAGCGTGFLAVILAQSGWQVTAMDNCAAMAAQAQSTAAELGVSDRITFLTGNAESTQLPPRAFDAVVSRHASWLFLNPEQAYREWVRLLKPGGILLNLDANWLRPLWSDETAAAFRADEAALRRQYGAFRDIYHDRAQMRLLRKLPLAFRRRPAWDEAVCGALGLKCAEIRWLPGDLYWNPFLARRYRTMPTFVLKAQKAEADCIEASDCMGGTEP